jgi:hypothetical protein
MPQSSLRIPSTLHAHMHTGTLLTAAFQSQEHEQRYCNASVVQVQYLEPQEAPTFL